MYVLNNVSLQASKQPCSDCIQDNLDLHLSADSTLQRECFSYDLSCVDIQNTWAEFRTVSAEMIVLLACL